MQPFPCLIHEEEHRVMRIAEGRLMVFESPRLRFLLWNGMLTHICWDPCSCEVGAALMLRSLHFVQFLSQNASV